LLAPLLQVIHRVIAVFLTKQAGLKRTAATTGAVTLIQRFGSAANLNIRKAWGSDLALCTLTLGKHEGQAKY
jgi:hypothetical protein